jgi:hypothetical protein
MNQWAHVQSDGREKLLQKIKENLLVAVLVAAVNHQALLDLHVDLTRLCDEKCVAACILQPSEPEVIQDLDVSFLLQVLRIELGENVSLVDELHEFRRELGVVVLLDVLNAAVVPLVEQSIGLVQLSVSAHSLTEAEALWAAQDVEEQLDVLWIL